MRYYGKVFGAIIGWLLMRHPIGAILGAIIGHALDARWLSTPKPRAPIDDAYVTLGVEPEASEEDIDRAYRQLMSKYHPDRVAGAAEEIRALAEERARAINAAYDRIRAQRRMRR